MSAAPLRDEFDLIDRLTAILPPVHDRPDVIIGIGDDAAVLDVGGHDLLVATTDAQVAGTHFMPAWLTAEDVGWRALAVNVSDVAAMGGRPHTALVSLVLPRSVDSSWLEAMYRGLAEAARKWGVAVVGGNVARAMECAADMSGRSSFRGRSGGDDVRASGGDDVRGPGADDVWWSGEDDVQGSGADDVRGDLAGLVVDVMLLGSVEPAAVLTRGGARPGDRVLVVGSLGGAAAGRHLLAGDVASGVVDETIEEALKHRWRRPHALLQAARAIAETGLATAMIDVSDGLAADIRHVCKASDVGVRLEAARLPLAPGVKEIGAALAARDGVRDGGDRARDGGDGGDGGDARDGVRDGGDGAFADAEYPGLDLALGGGEDYALLLTAPPGAVERLSGAVAAALEAEGADDQASSAAGGGVAVVDIGETLEPARGLLLTLDGGLQVPLPRSGWLHID